MKMVNTTQSDVEIYEVASKASLTVKYHETNSEGKRERGRVYGKLVFFDEGFPTMVDHKDEVIVLKTKEQMGEEFDGTLTDKDYADIIGSYRKAHPTIKAAVDDIKAWAQHKIERECNTTQEVG